MSIVCSFGIAVTHLNPLHMHRRCSVEAAAGVILFHQTKFDTIPCSCFSLCFVLLFFWNPKYDLFFSSNAVWMIGTDDDDESDDDDSMATCRGAMISLSGVC